MKVEEKFEKDMKKSFNEKELDENISEVLEEKKEDAEYLKGILESYGYEVYIREDEFGHETLQTYFVVQAGAFSNSENAQNYAAELNRAGINAYATLMENGYYMVFCGTFKNKDNADRLKDSIVSAGYEAVVIEYQM